jgi:hypothetical protein
MKMSASAATARDGVARCGNGMISLTAMMLYIRCNSGFKGISRAVPGV